MLQTLTILDVILGGHMRKIKILLIVFALTVLFSSFAFCQKFNGINPEQPLSVSENIYYEYDARSYSGPNSLSLVSIKYIYLGVENNSIKLKKIYHDWNVGEKPLGDEDGAEIISLSLNKNKQALLKVNPSTDRLKTVELIITVIDEFYRIKVEELRNK